MRRALPDGFITETQAAVALGVHPSTLRYWRTHQLIPANLYQVSPPVRPNGRAVVLYREDVSVVDLAT